MDFQILVDTLYRVIALRPCYHSIASSTYRDDTSASAICHLYRPGLVNWCQGRPTQVSFYCFGGLSCNSSFYFAASWVHSEVIDYTHELTLLSSCDLFSQRKKTHRGQSACKINSIKLYNLTSYYSFFFVNERYSLEYFCIVQMFLWYVN